MVQNQITLDLMKLYQKHVLKVVEMHKKQKIGELGGGGSGLWHFPHFKKKKWRLKCILSHFKQFSKFFKSYGTCLILGFLWFFNLF